MRTAVAIAVLSAAFVAAQTPPRDQPRVAVAGSAVVSGTVVADDETRAPLRNAIVTLSRNGIEDIRTTTTDEKGGFTFERLPAGSFSLYAAKGAYIAMSYGAPKPGMPGSVVTLVEGQTFAATPIALARGGVIAGRLLDHTGQPVSGAQVLANQFATVNGERRRRSSSGSTGTSMTNAHGEYRIFGLPPGEYLVSSAAVPLATGGEPSAAELAWANQGTTQAPPAARPFIYAPTMFPGTADPAAGVVITIGRGEERVGVDFALQLVPVARVSGVVTGLDGRPASNVVVLCALREASAMLPPSGVPISRTADDGAFVCPGLPPGQYALAARGSPEMTLEMATRVAAGLTTPSLWGLVDVNVAGQDISNLSIRLQRGVSVSGQVVLQASSQGSTVDLTRLLVRLTPRVGAIPIATTVTGAVGPDGAFQLDGVVPEAYRLSGTPSAVPWSVRSALLGGRDVADELFTVTAGQNVSGLVATFSDAQTDLSGVLTDGQGRPAPQLYVVVFTTDKTMWMPGSRRVQTVRSSENGAYAITGLPPGEYYLCALTEIEDALLFEASYLEQFVASSIKITLGEGEKKRQDLQVVK